MAQQPVVSSEEWLAARKELLEKEKAFTRLREELSRQRRDLPWEKVEKEYLFEGPGGRETLLDLFGAQSQLIVYHFMFDPEWEEGCKSCSFLADHYSPSVIHLQHRDVNLVTVSRAPLGKLQAFRERMGWDFKWVSTVGDDFSRDYHVLFTSEEIEQKSGYYNYDEAQTFPVRDAPGISIFARDDKGTVFHTYSAYARGLDAFIGAYQLLDIVPKGRDEADLSYGMEWLRHRDRYGDATFVDPYTKR